MASRSLNRVQLIGNLTRDPELRYTPQGTAVCSFGLATNRTWTTDAGEKHEDAEFHRIVAWDKLAELFAQLLFKGRRVFIEGRLQTRQWTTQDGSTRQTTEIVASDMIILDSRLAPGTAPGTAITAEEIVETAREAEVKGSLSEPAGEEEGSQRTTAADDSSKKKTDDKKAAKKKGDSSKDIPF